MALLSRPANLSKNVADTITIDYAELAALPAVPAGFYKNTNNWKEVFLKVKNKASGQKSVVHFVPPSTVGTLMVSDKARSGAWEIHSFVIRDFDRGEILITKNQIPNQAALDFNVISGASHGDIYVAPGQTLTISSNGFKQYGDFVVDAGGTLVLDDGGGILEIEVLGNCIINGTILGKQGKHTGGNWSKISSLGENLTFNVVQKAGGNGGDGELLTNNSSLVRSVSSSDGTSFGFIKNESAPYGLFESEFNSLDIGTNINFTSLYVSGTTHGQVVSKTEIYDLFEDKFMYAFQVSINTGDETLFQEQKDFGGGLIFEFIVNGISAGGTGGLAAFGNGGGGGRSAKFIAQAGNDAIDVHAGTGAGASVYADEYGENGPDSTATLYGGGGGFRGAHGQAIYIKAQQIQGSGTIDVSGQKGGDGGAGNEYLSGGDLFANGAGGGAAGGNGGKVWLRAKSGTPALTINTIGGEKGVRGLSSSGATEAQHGEPGDNGSYSFSLF